MNTWNQLEEHHITAGTDLGLNLFSPCDTTRFLLNFLATPGRRTSCIRFLLTVRSEALLSMLQIKQKATTYRRPKASQVGQWVSPIPATVGPISEVSSWHPQHFCVVGFPRWLLVRENRIWEALVLPASLVTVDGKWGMKFDQHFEVYISIDMVLILIKVWEIWGFGPCRPQLKTAVCGGGTGLLGSFWI